MIFENLFFNILFYYLLLINLATFLVFAWDKQRAMYQARRVPEKTLWLLSLAGGSLGAIIAMGLIKHKRKKMSFVLIMALIVLLQTMLIYFIIKWYNVNI